MKAYTLQIIKLDESYTLPLEVKMLDTLPLETSHCPSCFTYQRFVDHLFRSPFGVLKGVQFGFTQSLRDMGTFSAGTALSFSTGGFSCSLGALLQKLQVCIELCAQTLGPCH